MNPVNLRIINENLHDFLKEYEIPAFQYFLREYKFSRFSIVYLSYNNIIEYVKPMKYKTKNKYIRCYNKN